MMVRSSMKQAMLQSNYTPVYFYQFSFVGTRSESRPIIPGKWCSILSFKFAQHFLQDVVESPMLMNLATYSIFPLDQL